MSEWKELKKEIEATLNGEKKNLEEYEASMTDSPDMYNCQGWVEALNYVLKGMNFYENKNEEE